MVKVCSVVDGGNVGGGAAEYLRFPCVVLADIPMVSVVLTCVQVAIKVDHGHWPVGTIDRAKQRECDGVITSKSNDTWQCLPLQSRTLLVSVGGRRSAKKVIVSVFDLLEGIRVIVGSNWNISAI
jgi:hypothetical protein